MNKVRIFTNIYISNLMSVYIPYPVKPIRMYPVRWYSFIKNHSRIKKKLNLGNEYKLLQKNKKKLNQRWWLTMYELNYSGNNIYFISLKLY